MYISYKLDANEHRYFHCSTVHTPYALQIHTLKTTEFMKKGNEAGYWKPIGPCIQNFNQVQSKSNKNTLVSDWSYQIRSFAVFQ